MKEVVIFGGAGYIGSWVARRLARKPDGVRVILADIKPPATAIENSDFVECDVRHDISGSLAASRPDWIFNFAAVHREPGHARHEYFDTNVAGARNVCAYAEKVGCRNILFTSSISVYGPTTGPVDEESPKYPTTPYGISKLCAELIHEGWQRAGSDRRLIICRPGVIYGPGDIGNILRMLRAVKKRYFFFPGSPRIRKSYGYIFGLIDSFEFMIGRPDDQVMVYNYVERETETIGAIVAHAKHVLGVRSMVISIPKELLVAVAWLVQAASFGKSSIHPVRVRKAATATHVIPRVLQELKFPFQYDFQSSIRDWASRATDW